VIARIQEIDPNIKVSFVSVTLDDFDSVRAAAAEVNGKISKLHYLINNAGVMAIQQFTKNKNGIEMQFATNHLGHFLLTKLLFDKILAAGPGARIVNLTSLGHKLSPVWFDDYNFGDGKKYDTFGWVGYGQSKTANILFSLYLANKLRERGIQSFGVHPGAIFETNLGTHLSDVQEALAACEAVAQENTGRHFPFEGEVPKSMAQGISTTLVAALDPRIEAQSGMYMTDCQPQKTYEYAEDMEGAEKLWKLSEKLVGEKFEI
jgi:NAD(P)-dependent dehydrogenase (short-subunit alcohol dehydrogenase family)